MPDVAVRGALKNTKLFEAYYVLLLEFEGNFLRRVLTAYFKKNYLSHLFCMTESCVDDACRKYFAVTKRRERAFVRSQ